MRQGIILVMLVVLAFAAFLIPAAADTGIIRVMDLNMRSGPSIEHPPVKTLAEGTRVTILEHKGEWLKIAFNGDTGYIRNKAQYVRIIGPDDELGPDSGAGGDLSEANDRMEEIDRRIAASQNELNAIAREEEAVLKSFNDADRALNRARREVTAAGKALKKIDADIQRVKADYENLKDRIKEGEAYASERLVALYKLQWMGKLPVLATADSMLDFFNRKNSLERILRSDEALLASLNADLLKMTDLLETLNQHRADKADVEKRLKTKAVEMEGKQRERKKILDEIRGKKSLQLAAIQNLEQSAKELSITMNTFTETTVNPTAFGDLSHKPFSALKGLLIMPVKGKIANVFGHYRNTQLNVVNFRSGITIEADRGEPIRAVYGGTTLFSDWFKGYGNMIIIDHGDHYYTVYAHLEEQFKSKGDPVEAGEVIATVGDTGSITGPNLHFEVRHHGKPEDPLEWINKG